MAFQPGAFQQPGFQTQRAGAAQGALPPLAGDGAGEVVSPGEGLGTFPALTAAASGSIVYLGAGFGSLQSLEASAAGAIVVTGDGAASLSPAVGDGEGVAMVSGPGLGQLQSVSGQGSGEIVVTGDVSASLSAVAGQGEGAVQVDVVAVGQGALPALSGAGVGQFIRSAVHVPVISAPASFTYQEPTAVRGRGRGAVPSLFGRGSGIVERLLPIVAAATPIEVHITPVEAPLLIAGVASVSVPAISGVGEASSVIDADVAAELPALSARGRGRYDQFSDEQLAEIALLLEAA